MKWLASFENFEMAVKTIQSSIRGGDRSRDGNSDKGLNMMYKNRGRPARETKTAILHWFFLSRKHFFLSQSICSQMLVLCFLAVCRWKGSVMMSVVCCSIYTYVSFHMSTILTNVQRFWELDLFSVEYQGLLHRLIRITMKRCTVGALTWSVPSVGSMRGNWECIIFAFFFLLQIFPGEHTTECFHFHYALQP